MRKMRTMRSPTLLLTLALALATVVASAPPAAAQSTAENPARTVGQSQGPGIWLPRPSPGASVAQAVGVTDVEIVYHRPSVNDRTIWGGLVPYGQVWRAGANENTLIAFSRDVTVEGKPLAAGTYGFQAIPTEDEWTLIFSRDTTAWGSYSYDESRDALRVQVTPESAPFREQMLFTFDDVADGAATITLRWEELAVPFRVETDLHGQTLASIRNQLRGAARFNWLGWNQAAGWALAQEVALEEALGWADTSIQNERRFENLSTKAQILAKLGRGGESDEVMAQALEIASPLQLHGYGRQLLAQDRVDEAVAIFERNAARHPDAWFVDVGLARGLAARGESERAAEHMRKAHENAPEAQKAYIQGLVEQLEAGEDI